MKIGGESSLIDSIYDHYSRHHAYSEMKFYISQICSKELYDLFDQFCGDGSREKYLQIYTHFNKYGNAFLGLQNAWQFPNLPQKSKQQDIKVTRCLLDEENWGEHLSMSRESFIQHLRDQYRIRLDHTGRIPQEHGEGPIHHEEYFVQEIIPPELDIIARERPEQLQMADQLIDHLQCFTIPFTEGSSKEIVWNTKDKSLNFVTTTDEKRSFPQHIPAAKISIVAGAIHRHIANIEKASSDVNIKITALHEELLREEAYNQNLMLWPDGDITESQKTAIFDFLRTNRCHLHSTEKKALVDTFKYTTKGYASSIISSFVIKK